MDVGHNIFVITWPPYPWHEAVTPHCRRMLQYCSCLKWLYNYSDHSPDFCRDMWLRKSCGLRPQENMAASGREYGFLWLQRCCCLRQQPTVTASGRKSKGSSQWATQQKWSANASCNISEDIPACGCWRTRSYLSSLYL